MVDSAQAAPGRDPAPDPYSSAWAPLRNRAFRILWTATFVGNIGTWMQTVGAQWFLVDRHAGSATVAFVQAAASLPVLLLTIPAGVVAEFVDRRRLLLAVQAVQTALGSLLAVLTLAGRLDTGVLLALTFLLGAGAAVQLPAYQAFIPGLVPRRELGAAASLSSLGVNLARAVGPAIAGVLVTSSGVGGLFALNAARAARRRRAGPDLRPRRVRLRPAQCVVRQPSRSRQETVSAAGAAGRGGAASWTSPHPREEGPTVTDRTYVEDGLGTRLETHDLDFAVETRVTDAAATVVVTGELDIATAPLLCSALAAQRSGPAQQVEVDLSRVTFLDSYAAGALETARRGLEDCGLTVSLRDVGPRVRLVLRLTGYDRPGDGILRLVG